MLTREIEKQNEGFVSMLICCRLKNKMADFQHAYKPD
jgi:hypothetical protein